MSIRLSLVLLCTAGMCLHPPDSNSTKSSTGKGRSDKKIEQRAGDGLFGRVPLAFEPNVGQSDDTVKFLAHGSKYTLFLTPSEAVFGLNTPRPGLRREPGKTETAGDMPAVVRLSFGGSPNPLPEISGTERLPGRSNYFIGSDPALWHRNVANFRSVTYHELYPGIDMIFRESSDATLEYDFTAHPDANVDQIRLRFVGTSSLEIDEDGDLVLNLPSGILRQRRPIAYQERDGKRTFIGARFALHGSDEIGFEVAKYDHSLPLVIDPPLSLVFSTFFGGDQDDSVAARGAVDPDGTIYLAGTTFSTIFPGLSQAPKAPLRNKHSGGSVDSFAAKLSKDGQTLLYAAYLGGNNLDDGASITTDGTGDAYVAGMTASTDFPTTGSIPSVRGLSDVFIAKLGTNGDELKFSVVVGGSNYETAHAIAVDSAKAVYVCGATGSADFPMNHAARKSFQGYQEAFVLKINPAATAFIYSTFLGGEASETAFAITTEAGYAYVTGVTGSSHFQTAHPAGKKVLQPSPGGVSSDSALTDVFVSAYTANGALYFSTYLGGKDAELGHAIKVQNGKVYVAGSASSTNFPLHNQLYNFHGGSDAFVSEISGDGSTLLYSTYLGGSDSDSAWDLTLDQSGNMYITGATYSADFPTESPFQDALKGYISEFVTKISAKGDKLLFSTYLGGPGGSYGRGIGLDAKNNIYVTGGTSDYQFPTKRPYQGTISGSSDLTVAKIGKIGRVYLRE